MFKNKRVLVTAGPTHEPIDPVRFIGNKSSGKMGISIANVFKENKALVDLFLGPVSQLIVNSDYHSLKKFVSSSDLFNLVKESHLNYDIIVMCAAVADFTPKEYKNIKIKKQDGVDELNLELKKTTDILAFLGENKSKNQIIVGFSLETNNAEENALKKLSKKKCNIIVMNSLEDEGAGFEVDTNKVTIYDDKKNKLCLNKLPKLEVAKHIAEYLYNYSK